MHAAICGAEIGDASLFGDGIELEEELSDSSVSSLGMLLRCDDGSATLYCCFMLLLSAAC